MERERAEREGGVARARRAGAPAEAGRAPHPLENVRVPGAPGAAAVARLQHTLGNAHVQRLLAQRTASSAPGSVSPEVEEGIAGARGGGAALDSSVRGEMETAFGADFGGVRVHTGGGADALNRALGARAFTTGADVFFRSGEFSPSSPGGKKLLAHELAHVVQQGGSSAPVQRSLALGPVDDAYEREADAAAEAVAGGGASAVSPASDAAGGVRRKLIMTGAAVDTARLLKLMGGAAGLELERGTDDRVTEKSVLKTPARSASLTAFLRKVIGDAARDAEVHVGRDQPRVAVGAFPVPSDLSKGKDQRIDVDDILEMEKGIPGWGVAAAAHEIDENYRAHALTVVPGKNRRPETHEKAIETESDVSAELIEPGRRVADATQNVSATQMRRAFDYSTHYRVLEMEVGKDKRIRVTGAARKTKEKVSSHTADRYAADSDTAGGAGIKAAGEAIAKMQANKLATARLEGHADKAEDAARALSRARMLRAGMVGEGIDEERFEVVGAGTGTPAATGTTEDDRARNRRVEITVSRPA